METTTTVPPVPSQIQGLSERITQFGEHVRAGTLPMDWVTAECRQKLGLVTMADPLIEEVLVRHIPEDDHAEFVVHEGFPSEGRAVVTFDTGEVTVEQIWVEDDGRWQIDVCANQVDPLGAGVPLLGDSSADGLAVRIRLIADAMKQEEVGIYQWMSLRCRAGLIEVMEDYSLILLYPGYGADFVDLTAVIVDEVDGDTAFTSVISEADFLAPGGDRARWAFEHSNWFYDGCPTDEEAESRDEQQVQALLRVHAALIDLEIPGMTSTGFYDTDINGPLERVYGFELISQTPAWGAVQVEFMEQRWPEILDEAGYEVLRAGGQHVEAVHRDDPMGQAYVRLESTYLDDEHERHFFWLTLRYR
ncbi:MAG: hypothetical protein HKN03_09540 [Acidimicrobiales bacterium]|nr:hypothetical protein [Acidimicrobiales bacterium]